MLLNNVKLIGRLTRDPELRYTNTGKEVLDIGFAISGLKDEETSFVKLTFWGKQAARLVDQCGKGDELLIDGRLKQERWKDKDGGNRSEIKVIVGMFSRGFKKMDNAAPQANPPAASYTPAPAEPQASDQGDLPF